GEAKAHPNIRVGYFAQEPELGSAKTVREAVEEGVKEVKQLIADFEAVSTSLGEPMDDDAMEKALARQAELQDKLDAADAWNLDQKVDIAMDALRCPAPEAEIAVLSGGEKRRVAL